MKIKIVPSHKIILVAAATCATLLAFSQNAKASRIPMPPITPSSALEMSYTGNSPYLLGTVVPGQLSPPGQVARDVGMTNFLRGMGYHTQTTSNGSLYSRTTLPGGPLATATGAVPVSGLSGTGSVTINLSQFGTFQYLVAAYDGPNGGAAVWNIAGLTGTITIYGYAKPEMVNGHFTGNLLGSNVAEQGYFRITSFTLLNPTGVPDGGTTIMLLGAALGALGVARRYLLRS